MTPVPALTDRPAGSPWALYVTAAPPESVAVTFTLTGTPTQEPSAVGAVTVTLFPAVQVNVAWPVASPSVAVTVTLPLNWAVMVPEMTPVAGSIASPGGSTGAENTSGKADVSFALIGKSTAAPTGLVWGPGLVTVTVSGLGAAFASELPAASADPKSSTHRVAKRTRTVDMRINKHPQVTCDPTESFSC